MASTRLSVGVVVGAHGVRGQFKVKPFTDQPKALDSYGPVWLEDDTKLSLKVKSVSPKGHVLVSAREVTTRDQADALRGIHLYIDRQSLPETADDELYHADLIGMAVATDAGQHLGEIIGIHDFGAGEIVEIRPATGSSFMLPFAKDYVAKIDSGLRQVVVAPPEGMVALVTAPPGGARGKRQNGKQQRDG